MSRMRPPLTTSMTGPLDDAVLSLISLDVAPGPLVLGPLLGQDQAAVLVLLGEDEGLDLVAERHDLVGVDVVADRQLAAGDHALGLVADVEQDLVPVDLDDRALDDLAVLDVDDGGVDGVVEAAAEVVVGDLAGGVRAVFVEGAAWGHRRGRRWSGVVGQGRSAFEGWSGGIDARPDRRRGAPNRVHRRLLPLRSRPAWRPGGSSGVSTSGRRAA